MSQQPQWVNNHNKPITTTSQQPQRANNRNELSFTTSRRLKIREIRSVRKKNDIRVPNKIRVIRKIRVQTSRAKNPWDLWDPCAKKYSCSSVQKNIRVIRVQKNLVFKCAEKHSCYSNYSCSKKSRVQKKYRVTFRVPRSRATIKFTNSKCHR